RQRRARQETNNPKNQREWLRQNANRKNKKMDQRAHRCPDEPEQRRKRHDFRMIFERDVHETTAARNRYIILSARARRRFFRSADRRGAGPTRAAASVGHK